MEVRIKANYKDIVNTFHSAQSLGKLYYSKVLDKNNTLFIFEKYTFMNKNRMSLTVSVTNKGEYNHVVIKSMGSAQGLIIRFDWGAGSSYEFAAITLLKNQGFELEEI